MSLSEYKRDTGDNFLDFWFFKCKMTRVVAAASLFSWPFLSYILSDAMINQTFTDLLVPTLPACIFFFFFISLGVAVLIRMESRSLNRFIEKVNNQKPVSYFSYKENGHILHSAGYEGKVFIEKGDGVKKIDFN